jgi:hypothetical protein
LAVLSGLGCRYTHPGRWIHLPFRGHWPYRLRSNNGSCSRTNDWQLSIYPRRRIPAFIPHGIKASLCGVNDDICVNLEFRNSLLELGCFAGSMVVPTILLFFCCFCWRSGRLEWWIRSYVRGHWFGCSLRPGTPLHSPWTLDSSALSWSLTLPIKEQQW